jgi:hypothetical protein
MIILADLEAKLEETLRNLANQFPSTESESFSKLNRLLLKSRQQGFILNNIEEFFSILEEREDKNLHYIIEFGNICLKENLEFLGEELLKFLIKSSGIDSENCDHFEVIIIIIEIVIEFNLEDYLNLEDGNLSRIRLSVGNSSLLIELDKLPNSKRLAILRKLYNNHVNKIISEELKHESHNELIQKYRNIISSIKLIDKEKLGDERWCRIFTSQNLSFSEETKVILGTTIDNPYQYDDTLFNRFNLLLFPNFGNIHFDRNQIIVDNTGDGCINSPTLEIYHIREKLLSVTTENISLSGGKCVFTLNNSQISALKELNPNHPPLNLFLIFNKFNKIFKLSKDCGISDVVKNLEINNEKQGEHALLNDLIDIATRMLERKYQGEMENLRNDFFADGLRNKGYNPADQTRSGRSQNGKDAGELDIMVRNTNGTPVSIIEAFRLSSCGDENSIIDSHLSKLLHDYDTVGHEKNYILVYAEAKDFEALWDNYLIYVKNLNDKEGFKRNDPNHSLVSFEDTKTKFTEKTDIRVGLAKHEREGRIVEVYHVVMNVSVKK